MSVVARTARNLVANVGNGIEHVANRVLPPQQRERALENLRSFSVRNPKLALFLAAQTALAGLPILLFLAFAISTLFASLVTCVLLGVIAAFLFTFFITGFALLFVIPSVVIGSCTASIFFFWGLVGYLILQRINGGETPINPGTEIGDKLNKLTGGRLRDLVDQADSDTQQERMALAPSQDETLHMDRRSEYGGGDTGTHRDSPRRRDHGQTNGLSHSREGGEAGQEGGRRVASSPSRDFGEGAQHHSKAHMKPSDPVLTKAVDWKKEFQQEGIAA